MREFDPGNMLTPAEVPAGRKSSEDRGRKAEDDRKNMATVAANIVTQFIFYMARMGPGIPRAREIVLGCGTKYGIDTGKLFEMQLDLQMKQPAGFMQPKSTSRTELSLRRSQKRLQRLSPKGSGLEFALALSVPYVSSQGTLRSVLLLNRGLTAVMKPRVFRQVLMRLGTKISPESRLAIWLQLLHTVRARYHSI